MTRRMLINARSSTELRIAIANDSVLEDLKIDIAERGLTRGNIYYGKIANIEPSLNAAFIDYGAPKHGFLAIQDVVPDAYYQAAPKSKRPKIEDVLVRGRPIVVQVTREPEGNKGAALTTNLSLAGRYLVLSPFDKTSGVSRKVDTEEVRLKLKAMAESLPVPDGGGVIVRTNALGQTKTALSRDMNALLRLWKRISRDARDSKGTRLLYSDQDIVLQGLRDYLDSSIQEVLVDEDTAHGRAEQYMRAFMPRSKTVLNRYTGRRPLFSVYDLEPQIQNIFERRAELPSGGSIVIDPTEALTAIDVNSGRSKKGASQEETAVGTNVEAAAEVGRQLRLRDIGGLIVVDFIDMRSPRNRRKVEKAMKDAMKPDKARFTVSRISANGLLEINRQRIHQALQMRTHGDCTNCGGTGRVASPDLDRAPPAAQHRVPRRRRLHAGSAHRDATGTRGFPPEPASRGAGQAGPGVRTRDRDFGTASSSRPGAGDQLARPRPGRRQETRAGRGAREEAGAGDARHSVDRRYGGRTRGRTHHGRRGRAGSSAEEAPAQRRTETPVEGRSQGEGKGQAEGKGTRGGARSCGWERRSVHRGRRRYRCDQGTRHRFSRRRQGRPGRQGRCARRAATARRVPAGGGDDAGGRDGREPLKEAEATSRSRPRRARPERFERGGPS